MSATKLIPSEVRLIPARAGLNAVAVPRRRNIQAGTAIFIFKLRGFFLMSRKFLFVFFCSVASLNLACGAPAVSNGNANTGNAAVISNGNGNLPEGLSTSPVPITGTTPGIPEANKVNMNAVPKGATPTPGIPDPKEANKPFKPGATPTPGIPDPETLKKQMNQPASNVNQAPGKTEPKKPANQ